MLGCGLLEKAHILLCLSTESLNPCFVGMWSFRRKLTMMIKKLSNVLILVLLGCDNAGTIKAKRAEGVLILVLLGCDNLLTIINFKNMVS